MNNSGLKVMKFASMVLFRVKKTEDDMHLLFRKSSAYDTYRKILGIVNNPYNITEDSLKTLDSLLKSLKRKTTEEKRKYTKKKLDVLVNQLDDHLNDAKQKIAEARELYDRKPENLKPVKPKENPEKIRQPFSIFRFLRRA